jgi:hypothetical protein
MPEDLKGIKSFSWTKVIFSDVTIIVYDESLPDKSMTFDCHKDIISRQIKIFNAMLTGHTTVESSSGEVQITDTMSRGLSVTVWVDHLEENLTFTNALNVMISA